MTGTAARQAGTEDAPSAAGFEQLAEWSLQRPDLPSGARANAKLGMLDVIAVSIAARYEPIVEVLAAVTGPSTGSSARPTVLGQSTSAPPQASAFANGALAHALDFDDSSADLGGHPSAVVLPAALAIAQTVGASGRDLLEAYAVGVEVTCALGRALNPTHYDSGWHPTATLGTFGATAAAGRLLGLTPDQLAQAFGLTAAFASGIKASFGTLAKPLQVGRAAMNGVAAAQLVDAGATARPTAFEAKQGFLATFQRVTTAPAPLVLPGHEGQGWSLDMPGLIIKRYPCCGSTHSAIEAALGVREQIDPDDIDSCRVSIHPRRVGHVDRPDPGSTLDAKFSLQYTVARALLAGAVRIEDFEGDRPWDRRTRALMDRISVGVLDVGDELPEDRFVGEVSVRTGAGEARVRVPMASGRVPGEMLEERAFWQKFENCSARALSPERAAALRAAVLEIEDVAVVDEVVEHCVPDVAADR